MPAMSSRWIFNVVLAVGGLAAVACGKGGGSTPDGPPSGDAGTRPPAAPYCTPRAGTQLKLTPIAQNLEDPVFVTSPPGDPRLFIVERTGAIQIFKNGALLANPYLTIAVNSTGDEQGLLGLAFHPRFTQNGRFFVHYVVPNSNAIRIAEYTATPTSDTASGSERLILQVPHPYDNHNGGTVAFGPDGYLYVSIGDGGGANDSAGAGQDPDSHLAKLLRLDVDGGSPYAIPASNPRRALPDRSIDLAPNEVFAWGLRNPYRFTIDINGDVWIGDVGQARVEELDVIRASTGGGQNFGWPVFEGEECFGDDTGGRANCDKASNYVMPVTQRVRTDGSASILAGPVYRGACMTDLVGRMFFGDYGTGVVRSFPSSSNRIAHDSTMDHTADLDPSPSRLPGDLSSFGTDAYGELYVTTLRGGRVYRIELE